jgi:hypothetical protein
MREWHRDDTLPVVIFAHSMGISQSSHSVIDAEVASIAEGEAETARKSLHEAVDQTLRIHSRRREFSAALQDMATCVSVHLRKYKHLPECREQILNQSARFLAGAELPSRTDYSLVDPTGKENAKEESYHRAWKRRLPDIVSDPADLSEVGKRAIALLSEQFRDQTSSSLPHPDSEAVWQYLREVIKIKHHLGVKISRGDPNVIESLIACLPALIENDNYCKLLRCFPEVFDERQQVVGQAMSEYLSRALQELELRWYGDFSKRLARLLDTKDNREIVESAADKEIALRILERVWGWGDDTQQRLVKSFNITSSELKNSIITGLCTELRDWTFKASEAAWYSSALKSIGIFMATHEISAQELSFDAARTLPVVLNAGSLEVVHAYLKTFSLPVSVLASQELHPQFTELIEDALQAPSRGSERMPVAQYEALRELSAQGHKETILGALQRVGNRTLEESEVYGIDRLIEYIHQNPTSFNKSLFTDGAKRLAHAKLSSADLKAAQLVAREFKVDLTSPEFKAAAVEGVTTIFKRAIGAKWDKPLFDALTKECGLNGVIDDSHLRETLKPIITLELLDGSARALNRVNWLLKRFHFKEPMPGAELREATMHAISSAICNGNGPVIRMLCTRMASELTTQDIVGVVKDAWHSPEGKRGCLENLRYLPDAVKHQLNRSLAFADYERDVGVAGAITYDRYMELRSTGRDIELKSFIKAVRREMDSLISSAPQDLQALQNKPHYRELILTIFPNNWGPDASFESTESCQDRSGDLAGFRIRKGQGFALAEGVTMRVKAGLEYDEDAALETDELISNCMQGLASGGYSRTSLRKTLLKSLEIEPSSAKTEENFQKKVFSVALHALSEGSSGRSNK